MKNLSFFFFSKRVFIPGHICLGHIYLVGMPLSFLDINWPFGNMKVTLSGKKPSAVFSEKEKGLSCSLPVISLAPCVEGRTRVTSSKVRYSV